MAYRWITAQELATALSTSPEGLRVVDVRGEIHAALSPFPLLALTPSLSM